MKACATRQGTGLWPVLEGAYSMLGHQVAPGFEVILWDCVGNRAEMNSRAKISKSLRDSFGNCPIGLQSPDFACLVGLASCFYRG